MSMAVKGATSVQRSIPGIGFQGDPGIFGFLGGVAKKVTGAVSRLGIPGISAGAGFVSGALGGILGRKTAKVRQSFQSGAGIIPFTSQVGMGRRFLPGGAQVPAPGIRGFLERAVPGGRTGMIPAGTGFPPTTAGYHINKSDYFLKDGTFVAKGSMWVKNRKRNPLNPRALSRAMSRLTSAKNAAKSLGRITIRKEC